MPKRTRWLDLPTAGTLVLAWACSQSESTDTTADSPTGSEAESTAQAGSFSSSGTVAVAGDTGTTTGVSSGGGSLSGGGESDGGSGGENSGGEAGSGEPSGSAGAAGTSAGGQAGASGQVGASGQAGSGQAGSGGTSGLGCNPNDPSQYYCTVENAVCEYAGQCYVCYACQLDAALGFICSWFPTECEQGEGGASGAGGSASGSGGAPSEVRCGEATCGPGQYCRAACSGVGGDPGPPSCRDLPAECNGVATCECVCGETANFCEEGAPEIQCGCA